VHRRTAAGLARTFQNIRLFGEMTALENVMTGMHVQLARRSLRERAAADIARQLIDRVRLSARVLDRAGDLAYGEQRRLEIARGLAANPKLLLLDEPAAGMNPAETDDLAALLRGLRADGLTLLLVEHDMGFVMDLCDRITVLNFGRVIADGVPTAIRQDRAVIEAYLGSKVADRLAQQAAAS